MTATNWLRVRCESGACLELDIDGDTVRIRESAIPDTHIITTRSNLAAFVAAIRDTDLRTTRQALDQRADAELETRRTGVCTRPGPAGSQPCSQPHDHAGRCDWFDAAYADVALNGRDRARAAYDAITSDGVTTDDEFSPTMTYDDTADRAQAAYTAANRATTNRATAATIRTCTCDCHQPGSRP